MAKKFLFSILFLLVLVLPVRSEQKPNAVLINLHGFFLPVLTPGPSNFGAQIAYFRDVTKDINIFFDLSGEILSIGRYQGTAFGANTGVEYSLFSFNDAKRSGFFIGSSLGISAAYNYNFESKSALLIVPLAVHGRYQHEFNSGFLLSVGLCSEIAHAQIALGHEAKSGIASWALPRLTLGYGFAF